MGGNNEIGEHSRKTTNSNNSDGERPFKKARYVWQLKGKYHLKDTYKHAGGNSGGDKEDPSGDAEENNLAISDSSSNNNNHSESSRNNNCNKCCLDTLLARSNALLETDDSSECPASDRSISSEEIPVTLVKPNPKNHDDFLHKWQARQVAKSFVDNTINSILEQWKLAPVDVADFVENCDSGGQVEDEGILMAIQSHGLHPGIPHARFQNIPPRTRDGEASEFKTSTAAYIDESAQDNFANVHNELIKQKSVGDLDMSCDSDVDKAIYENNPNLEVGDPMDFLSAAVSVAIQKKGLSSYSYG